MKRVLLLSVPLCLGCPPQQEPKKLPDKADIQPEEDGSSVQSTRKPSSDTKSEPTPPR